MAASSLTADVTPLDAGAASRRGGLFLGKFRRLRSKTAPCCSPRRTAERRIAAHPDAAILVAIASGDKFFTGGDDGRVVAVSGRTALSERSRMKRANGSMRSPRAATASIAWSSGKNVRAARSRRRRQDLCGAVERARARFHAERLPDRDRPLRWRDLMVSERRRTLRLLRMERFASFDRDVSRTGVFS